MATTMMKVKVEDELDTKRVSTDKEAADFVQDVKMLMAADSNKDRNNLKDVGLGFNIVQAETAVGVKIDRQGFEKELGGKTFTENEVKEFCLKYDLRLLQADKYVGTIDPTVGVDLTNFLEKNGLTARHASSNFFVMAPPAAFNLVNEPVPVRARDLDPVLFYKVTPRDVTSQDVAPYYVLVKKWGNDFTIFRAILGWAKRDPENAFTFKAAVLAVVLSVIVGIVYPASAWFSVPLAIVAAMILSAIITGVNTEGIGGFSDPDVIKKYNVVKWKTNFKY